MLFAYKALDIDTLHTKRTSLLRRSVFFICAFLILTAICCMEDPLKRLKTAIIRHLFIILSNNVDFLSLE